MPKVVEKDGRWALMVDGAPYLMLGVQVNNSSAWPGMLPKVWPAVEKLHANTVEAPVYWEQMEPVKGKFDFSVVDALLAGAREHKVHLVLLWFGTWKNGAGHYAPEWVKRDNATYPRVTGPKGEVRDTMSPFGAATMKADTAAFACVDAAFEDGGPAAHRDHGAGGERDQRVWQRAGLCAGGGEGCSKGRCRRSLRRRMKVKPGTWTEAFGAEAENTFQAWSIARYVEQVAKAGKAEYGASAVSEPLAGRSAARARARAGWRGRR